MTIRQIGFCTSAFKHILSSQINGVAGTDWARYVLENKNFNVGVAIALFRSPKVAPELNNIEKRFQTLCDEIEAEQSFKNDFELRLETDKVLLDKRKRIEAEGCGLSELDAQIGISALYTRDEWIRLSDEASQLYGLNDRKLDESHDARSTQRKLNEKLVLITKQMLPAPDPSNKFIAPWQLPLQMCNEGESLRESVERCLKNTLFTSGTVPSIRILGNAPLARYQYTYPKDVRIWKGVDGSILFFYACMLLEQHSDFSKEEKQFNILNPNIADYKWCTLDELNDIVKPKKYLNALKSIMIH